MEIKMAKKVFFGLIISFLIGVVLAGAALAQEGTPEAIESITDDQVNVIAKQLYCPVCENIPLDVCPTQACAEWRELIRLRLAQGWTEDEIKNDFALQYGDRVLASPPARGLNMLVYVIPPVAILAGAIILVQSLRSMRRSARPLAVDDNRDTESAKDADSSSEIDEYMQRVEEELRKR